MKTTYRRLVRQRIEAAFKIRVSRGGPRPVMDAPLRGIPPEVIDLATAPFAARFPELSQERKGGR